MDNNKQPGFLSRIFGSKAGKGALGGGVVALVAGALLPILPVSIPVIATGAVIGAIINNSRKGPSNG